MRCCLFPGAAPSGTYLRPWPAVAHGFPAGVALVSRAAERDLPAGFHGEGVREGGLCDFGLIGEAQAHAVKTNRTARPVGTEGARLRAAQAMQPPCLPCARRFGIFGCICDNGNVRQSGKTCSRLAVSLSSWILERSSISLSIPPSFHAALKRCSFLCTCSILARHVDSHATVWSYMPARPNAH